MPNDSTMVLDEMLEPLTRAFSQPVAEALVNLQASAHAQARIGELAEKCNNGELSDTERSEYEMYVHALDLIAVLQAKARSWLSKERAG
jgi:hypothetical protein